MYRLTCLACLIALTALAASSCGLGTGAFDAAYGATDWIPAKLQLDSHSFDNGGSIQSVSSVEHVLADAVVLDLVVSDAVDLHAFYVEVDYDETQLSPLSVDNAGLLGADSELLQLSVLDRPGHAALGLLQLHPEDSPGFSGSGVIARLHFARRPFAAAGRGPGVARSADRDSAGLPPQPPTY